MPRVGEKLNARSFFGGAKALNAMQTDFAAQVGRKHGLERGLERSRARHTTVRQYYGLLTGKAVSTPPMSFPSPQPGEGMRDYGGRVAKETIEHANTVIRPLFARSIALDKATSQVEAIKRDIKAQEPKVKAMEMLLGGLSRDEQRRVLEVAAAARQQAIKGRGQSR